MATIVLGITGSIAAYKAADIASALVKEGHEVHCVMTQSATEFIPSFTLQIMSRNPVLVDFQDEKQSWKPGHIDLADRADLMVIAPASAQTIGNLANGMAPDLLSSIYLATTAKVLLCPAMNGKMWDHVATQRNLEQLIKDGVACFGPDTNGMLACGYEGKGRLMPVESILVEIKNHLVGEH